MLTIKHGHSLKEGTSVAILVMRDIIHEVLNISWNRNMTQRSLPLSPSDTLFWQHMAKQHKKPLMHSNCDSPWNAAAPCNKSSCYLPHNTRAAWSQLDPEVNAVLPPHLGDWRPLGRMRLHLPTKKEGSVAVSRNKACRPMVPDSCPAICIRASYGKGLSDQESFPLALNERILRMPAHAEPLAAAASDFAAEFGCSCSINGADCDSDLYWRVFAYLGVFSWSLKWVHM